MKKQSGSNVGRRIKYKRIDFCPEAIFLEHNIILLNVESTFRLSHAPVIISLSWLAGTTSPCFNDHWSKTGLSHQHAVFWFAADSSICS